MSIRETHNIRTTIMSVGAVASELPDHSTDPDSASGILTFCITTQRKDFT
jgi:hypothetical protein